MKKAILALAAVLSLSSCASLRNSGTQVFIEPVVAIAVSTIVNNAVDEADRADKAAMIQKVAAVLDKFDLKRKPTQEEFEALILDTLPGKDHWRKMASKLGTYYSEVTANISDTDVETTSKVLDAIARGLIGGTAQFR